MKKILLLTFVLNSLFLNAQIINSNKSTIAEFYDGQVKTVELNGAKVSTQFRLKTWTNEYNYVNQPEIRSAIKNNSFFLNAGITNTSTFLNLNKFDFKENNGYTFGLTFQHSFNEIYLASDSLKYNPHRLQSYTVSLNYQRDKFNNFNPENNMIDKATPSKLILKGAWSLYNFNYRENTKFKYTWIPTFSGQVNIIGYNENDLQNYLMNDNITNVSDIVFTSAKSFDGKYGVVDNNIKSAQISFSLPIVPDKSFLKLPIISPIPYLSYEVFENNKPRLNGGFALGLLSSTIVDSKSVSKDGGVYRKFNVPSFLTIGVDWNYQDGIGSKPNYFVSGSIKLK
ncbi:hypothetical protein [Cellulophaga lytica]|uniref:hypothetical protein n=1 Tax=Cellulophaga lytica TaxID=979 RepID=UPI003CE50B2A